MIDPMNLYGNCTLCPRKCGVNRNRGEKGFCGMTNELVLARAALHQWEEPCISGTNGSGTVFFSGCSLRCVYCQNYIIANCGSGKIVTAERLADIFLELQAKKAHNINLVTGTHYVPHIITAISDAKKRGLNIPIVYNTSGYETVENIKRLEGLIDIYLPDFKYFDNTAAQKYSNAHDYADYAASAIKEMLCQTGKAVFDSAGIMQKGVIVRHLVLPGNIKNSKAVLEFLYRTFGDDIYISVMSQYTPMKHINGDKYKELTRSLTNGEYSFIVNYAIKIGIKNGFMQEGTAAEESFIPEFDNEGV